MSNSINASWYLIYNEITDYLDDLANIDPNDAWRHYLLTNRELLKDNCLFVRIPGARLGRIKYDTTNRISLIELNLESNTTMKYPEKALEIVNKEFIGKKIYIDKLLKSAKEI